MIKIIPASQYKTIPWKNGKGQTTELAISKNGTLDNFNWRLSIASVVEDGPFSDFSGYERNLILLEGYGISLTHDDRIDVLEKPLSLSSFDGASKTVGKLINGPIKDFNLMTKQGLYKVKVETYRDQTKKQLKQTEMVFIYSNQSNTVIHSTSEKREIASGHLAILSEEAEVKVLGRGMIIIQLKQT